VLVEVSDAIWMQVVVSVVGITLLTLVAWYRSWSKRMDKAPRQAASLNLAQHEIEALRAVTSS
jgi:type II secretory pathway pseudopilin PulG